MSPLEAMLREGVVYTEIRRELDVSGRTIRRRMVDLGLPNRRPPSPWTEALETRLRELRASGKTAVQIGKELGMTRNAIIGKCGRLGIVCPGRLKQAKRDGAIIANRRKRNGFSLLRRPKDRIPPTIDYATPTNVIPLNVSLLDLTNNQCRWVCDGTDDHGLRLYCGHPIHDRSYCAAHYRLCYGGPR